MKEINLKELRDFIRTHEQRFYVEQNCAGSMIINKAWKVEIEGKEVWVNFDCTKRPTLVHKKDLFKTTEEAKASIQLKKEEKKKQISSTIQFLDSIRRYWITNGNGDVLKEYVPLAKSVERFYRDLPHSIKESEEELIYLMEEYIRTGTIQIDGECFRKEQMVSATFRNEGAVIKLVNDRTVITEREPIVKLLKVIFGYNSWWRY